jgi:hypothetical protein
MAVTTNHFRWWLLAPTVGQFIGTPPMTEPKSPTRPPPHPPVPGGDDPFTLWLRVSLRRVHDAVAGEPVPEALRRLATGEDAEPRAVLAPTPGARGRRRT